MECFTTVVKRIHLKCWHWLGLRSSRCSSKLTSVHELSSSLTAATATPLLLRTDTLSASIWIQIGRNQHHFDDESRWRESDDNLLPICCWNRNEPRLSRACYFRAPFPLLHPRRHALPRESTPLPDWLFRFRYDLFFKTKKKNKKKNQQRLKLLFQLIGQWNSQTKPKTEMSSQTSMKS